MRPWGDEQTAGWIRRRARNVYRRPLFLVAVGSVAFVAALIIVVQIPRTARRRALALAPTAAERPDTVAMLRFRDTAAAKLARADTALAQARSSARRPRVVSPPALLTGEQRALRDSLRAATAQLDRYLARAAAAPLPASYRALAESTVMRREPHVAALLDTLTTVETMRNRASAAGGVDPIFVLLTAKLNDLGKGVEALAAEKRRGLVEEIAQIVPSFAPVPPAPPPVDTDAFIVARDSAALVLAFAESRLARGRLTMRRLDLRAALAREAATAAAGPPAPSLLAAATILAVAVAFAVALAAEMRTPRVSGAREAAAVAGVPVLVTVQRARPGLERGRRVADIEVPAVIDQATDAYRLLYSQLASRSFELPRVALAGDDPGITATVAINLAAVAVQEARSTLLIDGDFDTHAVSSALRIRPTPGVAEVLAGRVSWPETLISTVVGRGRTMDVMPAGTADTPDLVEVADVLSGELQHVANRYDCVILCAPAGRHATGWIVGARVAPVVVCVRSARTPIAVLRALDLAFEARGARIRGLVVWDADPPAIQLVTGSVTGTRSKAS